MSHLYRSGTNIFKAGNNFFKIKDVVSNVINNYPIPNYNFQTLIIDPIASNNRFFVNTGGPMLVMDINTFSILATIPSVNGIGLGFDPADTTRLISVGSQGTIINTATLSVMSTFSLGSTFISNMTFDPYIANNRFFCCNYSNNSVEVRNGTTGALITFITISNSGIFGLSIDPGNITRLIICCYGGTLLTMDTSTFSYSATGSVGSGTSNISFDPIISHNRIAGASNHLYVLNGSTLGTIGNIVTGTNLSGAVFDNARNRIIGCYNGGLSTITNL
ncbi:hypothetical protein [Mucilaginibacter sp.]|uniref:YncE family protein n=1 Tax=Mucilaginibacter sp. TaxID=1882438 RepID=UPI002633C619|nr:hypothetical protein [Mucilaginibacter sp.]MDB4919869.1 hypothetical protein [Mucilaginibacter sp.]